MAIHYGYAGVIKIKSDSYRSLKISFKDKLIYFVFTLTSKASFDFAGSHVGHSEFVFTFDVEQNEAAHHSFFSN